MQAKLIGLMDVNFTNGNGEQISGKNVFIAFKDEIVEGLRTERYFLKSSISLPENVKINDTIEISYNHKGKIESIVKA